MRKLRSTSSVPRSSRPPSSSVRGTADGLVQGALVDLFAAYGVAVAPLPRQSQAGCPIPDISAAVGFARSGAAPGRVTLSLSEAVLALMPQSSERPLGPDWVRELANQLMGRIKNRLLPFSVRLSVGASSMLDSPLLARHVERSEATRVYVARTLRGMAVVTLDGMPHDSELLYVGPVQVAAEGDAILF